MFVFVGLDTTLELGAVAPQLLGKAEEVHCMHVSAACGRREGHPVPTQLVILHVSHQPVPSRRSCCLWAEHHLKIKP
jgi:hypothetical protein